MTEYNLQILRSEDILANRSAAIAVLNAYKYHAIGQPISLIYREGDKLRVCFAMGKQNGGGIACGPDYYDLIGSESGLSPIFWGYANGDPESDERFYVKTFGGKWTDLTAFEASNCDPGTLVFCDADGTIVKRNSAPSTEGSKHTDWFHPYSTSTAIYQSEESLDAKVGVSVGGVSAGTTLEDIYNTTGQSISKLLDMILFPTYAPRYFGPKTSISANPSATYLYIYDNAPVITVTSTTARATAGSHTVYAGPADFTLITPENIVDNKLNSVGKYVWKATTNCSKGTDPILDSKGIPCSAWADNDTTSVTQATHKEYLEQIEGTDRYVLAARTNCDPASVAVYASWPIYTSYQPTGLSANGCYNAANNGVIITLDKQPAAWIDIPSNMTIKKLLQVEISGKYLDANNQVASGNFFKSPDTREYNISGHLVNYDRWVFLPSKTDDKTTYKLTIE